MSRLRISALILFAAALALAGCHSSGTAYNPPGRTTTSSFKHMYISNPDSPGSVYVYNLPVTAASTPAVTVSVGQYPGMLFVDAKGRLFVPEFGDDTAVQVYALPLTSTSTPLFDLTTSSLYPAAVAEDASGNVYVAVAGESGDCCIDIYDGPVNAAAAPSATIANNGAGVYGLSDPYDLAFGPNGDLYVSSASAIDQFTPPLSSSSTPSAEATPNYDNYGLRVDSSNRVFVANASADGIVNVYSQPFTSSSTPKFNLSVSSTCVQGLAFDGSGNLWAVDCNGALWEVKAPITSSSTSTEVLTNTNGYGIAFGP